MQIFLLTEGRIAVQAGSLCTFQVASQGRLFIMKNENKMSACIAMFAGQFKGVQKFTAGPRLGGDLGVGAGLLRLESIFVQACLEDRFQIFAKIVPAPAKTWERVMMVKVIMHIIGS